MGKPRTILMLLDKEYPGDNRVRREAVGLIEAGWRVRLLARNREGHARFEQVDGIEVGRLPYFPALGRRANHLLSKPIHLNPLYARLLRQMIRDEAPAALHAHDLPLARLALRWGRRLGIPVVLDFHENYPAMVHSLQQQGPLVGLLRRVGYFERLERQCARAADRILVVCDEQKPRLQAMGVAPERLVVIGNTLDPAIFPGEVVKAEPPGFNLLYTGIFAENRGLDTVIAAMPRILEKVPDCRLILAGTGVMLEDLRSQAQRLGVGEAVDFRGWVSFSRFPELIAQSHVCLVPHKPDEHTDTTYPNKIFEFMYFGKPLVVSDARPLRRIAVEEADAGLSFESSSPESFARCVLHLYDHPDERRRLGRNGRRCIAERYRWDFDLARLRGVYRELLPEG
jgi:glycosyltransferase involved in cell wall biosynthesis